VKKNEKYSDYHFNYETSFEDDIEIHEGHLRIFCIKNKISFDY
jgi:hypothetical protein